MKKYLAVFVGSSTAMSSWEALSESERQQRQIQGITTWKKWAEDHAASILETGGPLSKTTLTSKTGISDIRNNMSGFTIVKAESQASAARLFLNHPHFTIFPGEGVEVMEILPIPAG
jgi:hypothetical protein